MRGLAAAGLALVATLVAPMPLHALPTPEVTEATGPAAVLFDGLVYTGQWQLAVYPFVDTNGSFAFEGVAPTAPQRTITLAGQVACAFFNQDSGTSRLEFAVRDAVHNELIFGTITQSDTVSSIVLTSNFTQCFRETSSITGNGLVNFFSHV